jgi:ubiquinone/menaquinone biosynthesis C-methylase UbiE
MHDRHFHGEPARLRSPERVLLLEVDRVVALSLDGIVASTMLDVGTGSGLFAEAFANKGLEVTGIDDSREMVDAAQNHVPQGHFWQARAEDLPFSDKAFDLVFLSLVLHETISPVQALKEARRVAQHRVVILEWPYKDEEQGPPQTDRLEPNMVARFAREAGFQACEEKPLSRMIFYLLTP